MAAGEEAISDAARDLAADAMIRGATAPQAAEIADLASAALSEERDEMTPAEIRALAATAITQAQQISRLMGRLADLIDGRESDGGRG